MLSVKGGIEDDWTAPYHKSVGDVPSMQQKPNALTLGICVATKDNVKPVVIAHHSVFATTRQRRIRSHLESSMEQSVNDSGERTAACIE